MKYIIVRGYIGSVLEQYVRGHIVSVLEQYVRG